MVHSHLEELGPGARGYGNGNLERAYYNQGFTGIKPQSRRARGRTNDGDDYLLGIRCYPFQVLVIRLCDSVPLWLVIVAA
jgi:hypothetical protein